MDHEGGNGQGPGEIALPRRRRGRDLAALANLAWLGSGRRDFSPVPGMSS